MDHARNDRFIFLKRPLIWRLIRWLEATARV